METDKKEMIWSVNRNQEKQFLVDLEIQMNI